MSLVNSLIQEGWLKTPEIIDAFRKIKRIDFLPKGMENLAELNEALPIGCGQTISQPLVVAFMLELLQPRQGEKILDIGSGSGWTTALLAEIVGERGKVIAVELVPQLMESGKQNIAKYNFTKRGIVECVCADGSKGCGKESPYDKILVSARAEKFFPDWEKQLKMNGRVVTPIGSSIWLFVKKLSNGGKAEFTEMEYPGFVFVPLIESR